MKEYQIKSEGNRLFRLSVGNREIGKLHYPRWFSMKAEMIMHSSSFYEIASRSFFSQVTELKQNGKVLLDFKMNWRGRIIINTHLNGIEKVFIFKHKGIFKNAYLILDNYEQELLDIQPDFKWSKFNYDYNITATDSFCADETNEILLLTGIYCIKYLRSRESAAGA